MWNSPAFEGLGGGWGVVLVVAAGHLSYPPPWRMVPSQEGRALQGRFRASEVTVPGPCVSWHAQAAVTYPCQDSTSPTLRLASTTLRRGGEGEPVSPH